MDVSVTGNVSQGVTGLKQVQTELAKTAVAATKADSSIQNASKTLNTSLKTGANQATQAMVNLGRVVQDAPYGFIGIANNINPLLESFQRLKSETGSTKQALSALGSSLIGAGGLGFVVSIATAAMSYFAIQGLGKTGDEAEKAKKKVKSFKETLDEIINSVSKEASEVTSLVAVLKSETETRERKLGAIKELQEIQPEIFKGLNLEKNAVIGLDQAYKNYILNFKDVIAAKLIQADIEKKITELLKIQGITQTKQQNDAIAALDAYEKKINKVKREAGPGATPPTIFQDQQLQVANLNNQIDELVGKLSKISKSIKVKVDEVKITPEKVKIELPERSVIDEKGLRDLFDKTPAVKVPVIVQPDIKFVAPKLSAEQILKELRIQELTNKLTETIQSIAVDAFVGIGDAIGNSISGKGNIFGNIFSAIFKSLGAGIRQLGIYAITTSKLILALKASIGTTFGLAAGVALVAIGTLISAAASKIQSPKFATGVRNFSGGSALVGERGPERVFLPRGSSVQPNNELAAYGGGGITLMPSIQYSGDGFRIMLNRIDKQWGRNN